MTGDWQPMSNPNFTKDMARSAAVELFTTGRVGVFFPANSESASLYRALTLAQRIEAVHRWWMQSAVAFKLICEEIGSATVMDAKRSDCTPQERSVIDKPTLSPDPPKEQP